VPRIRVEGALFPRGAVQDARLRPLEVLAGQGHQVDDPGEGVGPPEHRPRSAEDLDPLYRRQRKLLVERVERFAHIGARGHRIVQEEDRIGDPPEVGLRPPLLFCHVESGLHLERVAQGPDAPLPDLLAGDDVSHCGRLPGALLAPRGDGEDVQLLTHEHQEGVVPSGGRFSLRGPDLARRQNQQQDCKGRHRYGKSVRHHHMTIESFFPGANPGVTFPDS